MIMCAELLTATEIILATLRHDGLRQVLLPADRALVEMTLDSFDLPWVIAGEGPGYVTVVKKEGER